MNKKNWIVAATFSVLCMAGTGQIQAQKVYKENNAFVIDFGPDTGFPQKAVENMSGKKNISNPSETQMAVNNDPMGSINLTVYKKLEIGVKSANGLAWLEAIKYCANLNKEGASGWRLPTLKESIQINLFQKALLALGYPSEESTEKDKYYWTITEHSDTKAWYLRLYRLYQINHNSYLKSGNTNIYARCVREIP